MGGAVMKHDVHADTFRTSGERIDPDDQSGSLPNGAADPPAGRRFPLIPFHELKLNTEPNYLVKGLLPRVGIGVVWGPPKCGKSFWYFDLFAHVALDWLYRGKRVQHGAVVYCAFEGAAGINARAEAFRRKHGIPADQHVLLYVMPMRASLVHEHGMLIAEIRAQLPPDVSLVAVGLDTLNRSFNGSESSDEDMTAYVNAADAIREAFNCFVGIVHHCGIDGSRPRGHTSLTGAIDVQIAVARRGRPSS
jgi:RecA-family ATPase